MKRLLVIAALSLPPIAIAVAQQAQQPQPATSSDGYRQLLSEANDRLAQANANFQNLLVAKQGVDKKLADLDALWTDPEKVKAHLQDLEAHAHEDADKKATIK